jgi:hypothetical protein
MVDWLLGRFILPSCQSYEASDYAKYGFSLEIPTGMLAREQGKAWQGAASDASGLVQFSFGASPFEAIGVQWNAAQSSPNLQWVLEQFSKGLESMGVEASASGQVVSTTKGDHELAYQAFEATEGDYSYSGVAGVWYCDQARRVHLLYIAAAPELAKRMDPLTEFERYLDSFVCH